MVSPVNFSTMTTIFNRRKVAKCEELKYLTD